MKFQWLRVCLLAATVLTWTGCINQEQYRKCVRRNEIQQERIHELESAQEAERLRADRIQQEYELYQKRQGLDFEKVAALEAALAAKQAIINQLSAQVGQIALPVELSDALADWASKSGSGLVTYDAETGVVRFKSDLLFEKGSDTVQSSVQSQLVAFTGILNTPVAQNFDLLIVGHTDNVPILKPATRAKHPSNWHLSAHRAISVESIFAKAGMAPTRLAVMGFGEFRPIATNKANNKGNPANRRVEIYIVPAGQVRMIARPAATEATILTK